MERSLLNAVPDWALFLIIVSAVALLSAIGLMIARRAIAPWRATSPEGVVAAVSTLAITLFVLVLAFSVVDLDQAYQSAQANVTQEASSLAQINVAASVFSPTEQTKVRDSIVAYIKEVENHEFPALRVGGEDLEASARLDDIVLALQQYEPRTQSEITFYDSAVSNVNSVVEEHRARVSAADSSLPGAFAFLLLITAILGIGTTYLFKIESPGLELTLVLIVAVVIGAGLTTALIFQYPFSGSLAVSSGVFHQGSLGQLLARYPG